MSDHTPQVSTALILAAGNGTRLKSPTPKPLLPVLGVPLLARTLLTLEQAGITDAYVVLGYQAERIRREIERLNAQGRFAIRVHWLQNDQWRQPNGLSVLAAESVLTTPFILAMTDHIFDPAVVKALRANGHRLAGIDLAVDYRADQVPDLEDATKVALEGDRIVAIGKTLAQYQAIDTGLFLASPRLFGALREACAAGPATLSDGVQRLADAGLARVTDIGDRVWQDIDTPEGVREAERKLLAALRKSSDGPIARYLNRPLSTALSRQLVKTAVTPNQLSFANLGVGLLSAAFAAVGGYVPFLVSGALFHLASVLDGTDGEVAKLTFRTSPKGQWIDTLCDQVSYFAFLVGVIIGVYRMGLPEFYLDMGWIALGAGSLSMMNISFYLLRMKGSGSALSIRYRFQSGTGTWSRVMRVVQYLGKRDFMAFTVMLLGLLGQVPLVLPLFGLGASLLLFPITLRAYLSTFAAARVGAESGQLAPVYIARPEPAWLVEQEADRASGPATG